MVYTFLPKEPGFKEAFPTTDSESFEGHLKAIHEGRSYSYPRKFLFEISEFFKSFCDLSEEQQASNLLRPSIEAKLNLLDPTEAEGANVIKSFVISRFLLSHQPQTLLNPNFERFLCRICRVSLEILNEATLFRALRENSPFLFPHEITFLSQETETEISRIEGIVKALLEEQEPLSIERIAAEHYQRTLIPNAYLINILTMMSPYYIMFIERERGIVVIKSERLPLPKSDPLAHFYRTKTLLSEFPSVQEYLVKIPSDATQPGKILPETLKPKIQYGVPHPYKVFWKNNPRFQIESSENHNIGLVYENLSPLGELFKDFSEEQKYLFIFQLLMILEALHLESLAHLNFSKSKIMIDKNKNAFLIGCEKCVSFKDSLFPEEFIVNEAPLLASDLNALNDPLTTKTDKEEVLKKIDIFQLGILLIELFLGKTPIGRRESLNKEIQELKEVESEPLTSFIEALVNMEIEERLSAKSALESFCEILKQKNFSQRVLGNIRKRNFDLDILSERCLEILQRI